MIKHFFGYNGGLKKTIIENVKIKQILHYDCVYLYCKETYYKDAEPMPLSDYLDILK